MKRKIFQEIKLRDVENHLRNKITQIKLSGLIFEKEFSLVIFRQLK